MPVPAYAIPPQEATDEGRPRRVGVEIEFIDLESAPTAKIVQELMGGEIEQVDPHRYVVGATRYGDFEVELDTQFAHKKGDAGKPQLAGEAERSPEMSEFLDRAEGDIREFIGDVAKNWLPTEVCTPPMEIADLPSLDELIARLRQNGAKGTTEGLVYAFGTQLNPEVPSLHAESLRRHLQAYLLLAPWLRHEIHVDFTRQLTPFIAKFPRDYIRLVLSPSYEPGIEALISDYLDFNATRNRELDLLPLFCHIDAERVRSAVEDERIKPRPTFHYRLPGTNLADPEWCIAVEWNRWVEVEMLAADQERLTRLMQAYLDHLDDPFSMASHWVRTVDVDISEAARMRGRAENGGRAGSRDEG